MKARKWEELEINLSDSVLKTLQKLEFQTMTPIQVNCFLFTSARG